MVTVDAGLWFIWLCSLRFCFVLVCDPLINDPILTFSLVFWGGWVSYLSAALIKCHDQTQLKEWTVFLLMVPEGEFTMAGARQQQVDRKLTDHILLACRKQKRGTGVNWKSGKDINSQSRSPVTSSSKAPCFHNHSTQHHKLRTKCSNIRAYGGHFSFRSPWESSKRV